MKKIMAFIISIVMILSVCPVYISAADESDYDPYGSNALGPSAPKINSQYSSLGEVLNVTKSNNKLVVSVSYMDYSYQLTLAFPKIGGARLYGEKTGSFATNDVYSVKYTEITSDCFDIKAVGGDGTSVRFTKSESAFTLDFYNSNGKIVTTFDSSAQQIGIDTNGEINAVKIKLPLDENEVIYGTGERFSGLNQNGKRTMMWNVDCGYHNPAAENAELWRGYKNVPILHSNAGYTVYYDSYYSANIDIGYTDSDACVMDFACPQLDLYVWTGTPIENLNNYTSLTGKSIVLPKWAYSYLAGAGSNYWFSNGSKLSAVTTTLQNVMDGYAKLGTPNIAAIYLEGITDDRVFDAESQSELYKITNSTGTRVLQWNRPDLERATQVKLLPDVASSDIPIVKDTLGNDSGCFIDFTHSNASKLLNSWLKPYILLGLKGGLIDFGEQLQVGTVFSDGTTGYEAHNKFSVMYAKGYHDTFSETLGNDFVTFARSAAAGSQKYTAFFSGDQLATFSGLRMQLSAGLSAGASGFAMWGGDLSGYEGKPTNEVFCRGVQLSAFSPIMRSHGTETRFPWDFGTEGESVYKKYYWLRENLLDSIYSSAVEAGKTGAPMMQALAMAYPEQTEIAATDDTYIFCDEILASPVLESSTQKDVVFPKGVWYNLYDGSSVNGGVTASVDAPLDTIPAYLRSGAILPVTLSSNLTLCDAIDSQTAVKALIITPPEESRTKTVYFENDESTEYTVTKTLGGYTLSAKSGNQAETVLAYDINPVSVSVDGKALQKISESSQENGYYTNENGVTVIKIGNTDWNYIVISEQAKGIYSKIWDFSSKAQLGDFDAYMNDYRYGYEKQSVDLRWAYLEDRSMLRENAWMCKESDQENGDWGGTIPDSASALTPRTVNLKNFETTVKYKISNVNTLGTVAIGFHETVAGQHAVKLNNWDNFGKQDGGAVSALACAAGNNTTWLYSNGAKLLDTTVSGANFCNDFYTLRIRVVGKECSLFFYDSAGKLLSTQTRILPDAIAESGAISYYATNDCYIKEISITALDDNGLPYDYFCITGNKWDFSNESTLTDFDAYMNDTVYGYERQSVSFRWNNTENGISANSRMASEANPDASRDGGVMCSSISSLTPKNIDLRNFETQIRFKITNYDEYWGAVSVGFRETWAGKHANIAGIADSWNFGIQGTGLYSGFVSAISQNALWVDAAGSKLLGKGSINSDFTADLYVMCIRVVENECKVSLYDDSKETLLYTQTVELPEKLAERGAISYYATNYSTISEITLTALDDRGQITAIARYSDGDVNRDGNLTAADLVEIKCALLTDTLKYGYDVNKECKFDISDLVRLKKTLAYK